MTLLYNIDRSLFSPQRLLAWLSLGGVLLFLTPLYGHAQSTGSVEGRVVDASDGTPLPGANVVVEGTSIGVSTNQNGRYRLTNVPTGSQTLTVTYVSYRETNKSVDVEAGTPKTLNFELEGRVLETGEVIVQGVRAEQLRSTQQKRRAPNVIDVRSADEIGQLPEVNVAEAVQRLPGIVMQTSRGEGRFVSIRGADPSLNTVTLNGQPMASTAESRATALDLLPASMVSGVEVVKSVTPDMDATAVGGAINVNTLSAFDRNGSFLFGSFSQFVHNQQYAEYGDRSYPFQANLTAGTQFGPDNEFGLVISGNASRRNFSVTEIMPGNWEPVEEGSSLFVPEELEFVAEDNDRKRLGFTSTLDWQPSQETSLSLQSYYTWTEETRSSSLFQHVYTDGGGVVEIEGTKVRYDNGFNENNLAEDMETENLWGTTLSGEQQFGALTLEASGTFTRGLLDRTNAASDYSQFFPESEFGTGPYEQQGGTLDVGGEFPSFSPNDEIFASNPSNYRAIELDRESESNTEDTWAVSSDLQWNTHVGSVPGYLKAGGQVRTRDKVVDDNENEFTFGESLVTLADGPYSPLTRPIQGGARLLMSADPAEADRLFQELCGNSGYQESVEAASCDGNQYFRLRSQEAATEAVENDSDNRETVYAGYGMAGIEVGGFSALGGVRIEHTEVDVRRFQLLLDQTGGTSETSSETFESTFTNVLPSLHLRYRVNNNLQFRAAWSNTIGRPDYEELAGFREFEFQEIAEGVFRGGVQSGNPDLVPHKAMTFEAAAEYYFEGGGLVSFNGYIKQIDDPIYSFSRTEEDFEFEGRFFDRITFSQERNAESGDIRGLEASYQQPLTFLTAPFDGLGIATTGSLVSSDVTVPSRPDADFPFFGQADATYNIIPYYQKGGLELRAAFTYQDSYLDEIGGSPLEDEYVGERRYVDLTGSYRFDGALSPGASELRLVLKIRNLTNEPETLYQGRPNNPGNTSEEHENYLLGHTLSGRTTSVGVVLSF